MAFQHHQTGTFNGIDTCAATSYGNFNFRLLLLSQSKARSISNRPDVSAHLTKLKEEGEISKFVESGKRNFADEFSSSTGYSKHVEGARHISLEEIIMLQDEASDRKIETELDHQSVRFFFNRR